MSTLDQDSDEIIAPDIMKILDNLAPGEILEFNKPTDKSRMEAARTEFADLWRNWPMQERLKCFVQTLSPEQTEDVRLLCWAVFLHGKDLKDESQI